MWIFQATDADIGSNSEIDFALDPAVDGLFSLQSSGPSSIRLSLSHSLDREANDSYSFLLFGIDRGSPPQTGSTTINIVITVRYLKKAFSLYYTHSV